MRNDNLTEIAKTANEIACKLRYKVYDLFKKELGDDIADTVILTYFIQTLYMYLVSDLSSNINPQYKQRWLRHFIKENEHLVILQVIHNCINL